MDKAVQEILFEMFSTLRIIIKVSIQLSSYRKILNQVLAHHKKM